MNNLYLTEITRTYWIQMLDEYWDEKSTPYTDDQDLWPYWLYEYFNEILSGESIGSDDITWNPEQHRLIPKYYILSSLVPPVKFYFVTMEEDDNLFKISCKRCNGFVIW